MDIQKFKNKIKKVRGRRNITITNSYGNNEAYLDYRSKMSRKDRLNSPTYRKLINSVNQAMADELLTYGEIVFPLGMGKLYIQTTVRKPKLVDGKLVYNAPVDWNRTLELWATNPESKVSKQLVKMPPGKTYSIRYTKRHRSFKNRRYYLFSPTRKMKIDLKDRINENKPISHKHFNLDIYGN